MSELICPRCLIAKPALGPIDEGMRQRFSALEGSADLPEAVCKDCLEDIRSMVSINSAALTREVSKEENKAKLWRGRVTLLKRARGAMKKKAYGKACIAYEKYIKSLEVVFDVNEDGLRPELFKERMATRELTLITSAYWDLMRIYDTSEKYRARMYITATKLTQFARVTPILLDIVKKAEVYRKQSKNPDVFKKLVRDLMYDRNACFIATSVFMDAGEWQHVDKLRLFRDQKLMSSTLGRGFVHFYYRYSPRVAYFLDRQEWLKPPVRGLLRLLANVL